MNHPSLDQCSPGSQRRVTALSVPRYVDLVNAPVPSLELSTSALIPTDYVAPRVVDGEVITTSILPVHVSTWDDTDATEPKRSLLRCAFDDPYWILMTLAVALGVSILATVIYGVIQITLAIGAWLHANGTTLAGITTLIILLMLCGGTTAAKCAGIHCPGCRS